jgi:hypothetical protein
MINEIDFEEELRTALIPAKAMKNYQENDDNYTLQKL